jgi:hypothetical protein
MMAQHDNFGNRSAQGRTRRDVLWVAGVGFVAGILSVAGAEAIGRFFHSSSFQQTLFVAVAVGVLFGLLEGVRRRLFRSRDRIAQI